MSGHGPKHQSPAFRAHLRAYGLDRPMWVRLKNALVALEECSAALDKAIDEVGAPHDSAAQVRDALKLLVDRSAAAEAWVRRANSAKSPAEKYTAITDGIRAGFINTTQGRRLLEFKGGA